MQEITAKSFIISDKNVIEFMRMNRIEHIRFIASASNDEICLLVKFPDYNKELTLGKQWMSVTYGKRKVYVRTPSILRPYVGKKVKIYRDEAFGGEFELFRVAPMDFEMKEILYNKKRRASLDVPYFSKTSYCVIPRKYIREHGGVEIFSSRLSFNRTDSLVLESGYIYCRIFLYERELGNLVYSLSKCTNGVRARVKKLSEIVADAGKDLANFQYEATVFDDNNKYNLIVFKEVKIES